MSSKSITFITIIFALILTGYILAFFVKTEPPSLNSGVRGYAYVGRNCAALPPNSACTGTPFSGTISIFQADNDKAVKNFSTDSNGRFYVMLPAGNYYMRKDGYAPDPRLEKTPFTVYDGSFSDAYPSLILVSW